MKRVLIIAISGYLSVSVTIALAYEPGTHGQLSQTAADQSVLAVPLSASQTTVLQDMGLQPYDQQILPDIQGPPKKEWQGLGPYAGPPISSDDVIRNLIGAGAQLEDLGGRPLNHFYDPTHRTPLNYALGTISFTPAFTWGTTSSCAGHGQNAPYDPSGADDSSSNQCYSLDDAESYLYFGLTNPDPKVRNQQFGDLFLTLGHVMHLVQDMAQPQHVRNDIHCDLDACAFLPGNTPSLFEPYVYFHAATTSGFATYPVVNLPTRQSYWTFPSEESGLADFTNSNFVSEGTNFVGSGSAPSAPSNYPSPTPDMTNGGTYVESIYDVYQDLGKTVPSDLADYCATHAPTTCNVTFIQVQVNDHSSVAPPCGMLVTGPDSNLVSDTTCEDNHASSYSIFEPDLETRNLFNISEFNFNAITLHSAMNYLLPRAIGYSAGLVNYFFRGRLDVQPDPTNPSTFKITNLSTFDICNGTLTVYYDDVQGHRTLLPTSSTPVNLSGVSATCGTGASTTVTVPYPNTNPVATSPQLTFVIKGTIGTEEGIAAKVVSNSMPYVARTVSSGSSNDVAIYKSDASTVLTDVPLAAGASTVPWWLTVFGKSLYTLTVPAISGQFNASVMYYQYSNGQWQAGVPLITSGVQPGGTVSQELQWGLAVNSTNLFVPVASSDVSPPWEVLVLDHGGNAAGSPIPVFVPNQISGILQLTANDQSLCIITDITNPAIKNSVYLVATMQPLGGGGNAQQLGSPVQLFHFADNSPASDLICGSSADRQYLLSEQFNVATQVVDTYLDVYDNSGNPVTSLLLTGPWRQQSFLQGISIAADGGNVYIGHQGNANQSAGFTVISRSNFDAKGNPVSPEIYKQLQEVATPNATTAVSLDMQNVLGGP